MNCSKVLKVAAAVAVAGTFAACVGGPEPAALADPSATASAAPSASASAADAATPTPDATDCYRVMGGYKLRLTASVATLSKMADAVVVGEVVSVGETRWATADGNEPARSVDRASVADVYRLATFRVTRTGRIDPKMAASVKVGSTLIVRTSGGQIGCKKFLDERDPTFDVGQEIAAFLTVAPQNQPGATLPGDYAVLDRWWVHENQVLVPDSTPMSVDDFVARSLAALP